MVGFSISSYRSEQKTVNSCTSVSVFLQKITNFAEQKSEVLFF